MGSCAAVSTVRLVVITKWVPCAPHGQHPVAAHPMSPRDFHTGPSAFIPVPLLALSLIPWQVTVNSVYFTIPDSVVLWGNLEKKIFFGGGDFPPRDEQARINTAGTCLWLCANAGYHQISVVGKFEDSITRKVTQYRSATDGRTEFLYQYRSSASLCWRAIKMPSCYTVSLTLIAIKWLGSAPTFYPIFGFFGTLPFDFLKYSLATNLHVMWCAIVLK